MNNEEILKLIPYGKENGISKNKLARLLNIDEKEVSKIIKTLRKNYIILVNSGDGCLYRTKQKEELENFIKEKQKNNYEITRVILLAYKEIEALEKENK
ncbi:MAG: hypothetical protein IJX99_01055 [Clostridia bacterium]|nr:hypothetical protein [Clostridia bacterium]